VKKIVIGSAIAIIAIIVGVVSFSNLHSTTENPPSTIPVATTNQSVPTPSPRHLDISLTDGMHFKASP
jgi:hypothetical protein